MTAEPAAAPETRKPRRMLWLWIGAFGFLGLVGAFCWLVLGPYMEVRTAAAKYHRDGVTFPAEAIKGLGGPRAAARKIELYIRLPRPFVDAQSRGYAVMLMGNCGPEAVPRLIQLLTGPDEDVRPAAVVALGWTLDPRAFEPLMVALADRRSLVRACAAGALAYLGDKRAIPALEKVVASDPDARVVEYARVALKNFRTAKPAPEPGP